MNESNSAAASPSSAAPANGLAAHSAALAAIVDKVAASTFAVRGRRHAIATGVLWRPGLVVTAAHVFRRTPAAATLVAAEGRSVEATLVGIDSSTDIALFRLAAGDASDFAPVATGDAASVRAGHVAIAVGRGGDGDPIASSGLVNRAGGSWQTWLGGSVDRLIRLDGGVYDGLSGAPVADANGAVIGIATAALSRSYGIVIPASTVSRVVDALLANGHVARPWLGIGAQPVAMPRAGGDAAAGDATGLLISSLAPGGPAERAGLLIGDIVVRVGNEAAADLRALRAALAAFVGKVAPLSILRGGVARQLQVEVGERPVERPRC
ncbi:MAG TPA: S1C family serine protease [Caldimonas sp.]|nr:S1C family serine protease [Caldimonas sp.]